MKTICCLLLLINLSYSSFAQDLVLATIEKQAIMTVCSRILVEVYKEIGIDVEIKPMTALRAQQEASIGSVDGEVARILAFGTIFPQLIRVPTVLYNNSTVVFVRKDSGIMNVTQEDLSNFRVARIKGIINTDKLTDDVPEIYDFDSMESMLEFVRIGRADLAITSRFGGNYSLFLSDNEDVVALPDPIISQPLYHFLHKKNEHIVPLINNKLKDLTESGELEELINRIEEELLQNID